MQYIDELFALCANIQTEIEAAEKRNDVLGMAGLLQLKANLERARRQCEALVTLKLLGS